MTDAMIRRVLIVGVLLGASAVQSAEDPTRPPAALQVMQSTMEELPQPEAGIRLQQILLSSSGNRAVINGQVVKKGETVDGARVLSISADSVVVNYRQNRKKLSLINKTKDVVR
ncbi:MAG TPA: Type II secretory pathway component [Oceanospirillales bacterium]|nr:Type II secretory pathway component [Oceanospirillaceae bacterium]HBS42189.1 Type II secretory pathway component [Oceanospirillales bacterium]